jgi:hypothetical protein
MIIIQQLPAELGAVIENTIDVDENNKHVVHSSRNPRRRLPALAYSDDVVLLANNTKDAQKLLSIFETVAHSLGMKLNLGAGKTEEIRLNAPRWALLTPTSTWVPSSASLGKKTSTAGRGWPGETSASTATSGLPKPQWIQNRSCSKLSSSPPSSTAPTPKEKVTQTLHSTHARMLRHCIGLPRANSDRADHRSTEWLYYGRSKTRGKTSKSAVLTLPAAITRQRLSTLGHWVRDHYYRPQLQGEPLRRHPVIDVLRFDPSEFHTQTRQGRHPTLRDAYQSAVQFADTPHSGDDALKTTVLVATGSRCSDKDQWYNESKARVKEIDRALLRSNMQRRLKDPKRSNFGQAEYGKAVKTLEDRKIFTQRWLTRKTRQDPLGEDKEFLKRLQRR